MRELAGDICRCMSQQQTGDGWPWADMWATGIGYIEIHSVSGIRSYALSGAGCSKKGTGVTWDIEQVERGLRSGSGFL